MIKSKSIVCILLLFLVASLFLGCTGTYKQTPTATPKSTPVMTPEEDISKSDGKTLFNYITKENNYKNWKLWPGRGEFYNGSEPHGALLTTYVSNNAVSTIENKKGVFPDDSIIVKENYNPEKKLMAITVMYKETGYDSEHGDWFWAKYQPNGSIDAEGKVKGCIDCHSKMDNNDYVFTGMLK